MFHSSLVHDVIYIEKIHPCTVYIENSEKVIKLNLKKKIYMCHLRNKR